MIILLTSTVESDYSRGMATQKEYFDGLRHLAKARARAMLTMVKAGKTLEDTGKVFGVTRQRAHKLITTYFPDEYGRLRK